MNQRLGRLKARAERVANTPMGELIALFGELVALPEGFGKPGRNRLFFPRTDFLAVSLTGARRGWIVP